MESQENSHASHVNYITEHEAEAEEGVEGEEVDDERREDEILSPQKEFSLRRYLIARSKWFQEWNRFFLLASAVGMFIDPVFFYTLGINRDSMCLYIDGWFSLSLTTIRCMLDTLHIWDMWLQLNVVKGSYSIRGGGGEEESTVFYYNTPRAKKVQAIKAKRDFLLDIFVMLPLPQVLLWAVIPYLLSRGETTIVLTAYLLLFLFHYFLKVYHFVCLLLRTHGISGYMLGTVWRGFALSLMSYLIASHLAGACWYLLGLQRGLVCLEDQCKVTTGCNPRILACKDPIYYGEPKVLRDRARLAWADNRDVFSTCFEEDLDRYYGLYEWSVQLILGHSRVEKILYPIFWGLTTLSSFGNLQSTTQWAETFFNIIIITSGLILVTMLIGNIKVFLHGNTSKKQVMKLKMRDIEWWMRKRNLPNGIRQRVRNYEWQRWAATRGVDECEMTSSLPEGLRREIKYHLCLDLVRQVPLFQHMDDLVLENICERVKSLVFTKGEMITRESDPVQRMLFIVRGHLQSSQLLREGVESCCMLGPGNFTGDELLSWCLRRPFLEKLPPSSTTLVTLETVEAFSLDATDVRYITQHFRYTFVKEKVKRSARYYSPGWRTWAAVAIQLAWRRYRHRLTLTSLSFIRPRRPLSRSNSIGEDRIRLYAAMLTSPKPGSDDLDIFMDSRTH